MINIVNIRITKSLVEIGDWRWNNCGKMDDFLLMGIFFILLVNPSVKAVKRGNVPSPPIHHKYCYSAANQKK
jgi:hypothetical protein